MKRRDLVKLIELAGYTAVREGDHTNFYNPHAQDPSRKLIQIPRHKEVNELTAKKILKDAGLR